MKIKRGIIVINRTKPHAQQTATALKTFFNREKVRQEWVETLPPRKNLYRQMADLSAGADEPLRRGQLDRAH